MPYQKTETHREIDQVGNVKDYQDSMGSDFFFFEVSTPNDFGSLTRNTSFL